VPSEGDGFLGSLEALGEAEVRNRLAKGEYGTVGHKRPMVEAWLDAKAHSRIEASSRESNRTARSAKNAAWIAAIAAIIAAICAVITLASV